MERDGRTNDALGKYLSVPGGEFAAAAELMRETYPLLCDGSAPRIPQDHRRASYFGGRTPEDGRIDWSASARAWRAWLSRRSSRGSARRRRCC